MHTYAYYELVVDLLEYEHYTMHRVGKNKNKMLQINNFVWFRKVSLVPAKDVRQARGAAPR